MKEVSLKSELFNVLQDLDTMSFTVDELTQIYLKHPSCLHTAKKAARQFVYRNMQRLMASGHLERLKADGRWPRYRVTPLFLSVTTPKSPSVPVLPAMMKETATPKADSLTSLKERLKLHQAEVLTAMGEMEEYEAICKEMPDFREVAQPRYNESRERCSRLLGRVKALESLLVAEAS